ncbi:hypothetical protein ACFYWS_11235 [Streptomyces sp. NPDC002795]|uniref:hypothetical protein n=1 Tax=Streptomyces sp. NPDC002795 TaxID=3364665 RepID=UPI00368A369D
MRSKRYTVIGGMRVVGRTDYVLALAGIASLVPDLMARRNEAAVRQEPVAEAVGVTLR